MPHPNPQPATRNQTPRHVFLLWAAVLTRAAREAGSLAIRRRLNPTRSYFGFAFEVLIPHRRWAHVRSAAEHAMHATAHAVYVCI